MDDLAVEYIEYIIYTIPTGKLIHIMRRIVLLHSKLYSVYDMCKVGGSSNLISSLVVYPRTKDSRANPY